MHSLVWTVIIETSHLTPHPLKNRIVNCLVQCNSTFYLLPKFFLSCFIEHVWKHTYKMEWIQISLGLKVKHEQYLNDLWKMYYFNRKQWNKWHVMDNETGITQHVLKMQHNLLLPQYIKWSYRGVLSSVHAW